MDRMDDDSITISTPKLTLSKVINPGGCCMQTPPLLPSVSIPFRWEEAPGKPRPTAAATPKSKSKSKTVRSLELPPRLQLHMPSPEGPYVGRSLSLACTFSFRKGSVGPAPGKTTNLGSGRWGISFREETNYYCPTDQDQDQHQDREEDSIDFSHSLRDFFRTEDTINNTNNNSKTKKMMGRSVKRRRSFFTFSTINSSKYLLADIYASFKQAVPWRRDVRS